MAEEKKPSVFLQNMASLTEPDNFQKYILGYKSSGQPRAIYDVIRDCAGVNKKKKHKKKGKKKGRVPANGVSFYMSVKGGKKKHKKKGKKHWHIDDV